MRTIVTELKNKIITVEDFLKNGCYGYPVLICSKIGDVVGVGIFHSYMQRDEFVGQWVFKDNKGEIIIFSDIKNFFTRKPDCELMLLHGDPDMNGMKIISDDRLKEIENEILYTEVSKKEPIFVYKKKKLIGIVWFDEHQSNSWIILDDRQNKWSCKDLKQMIESNKPFTFKVG